jgi:hypothetical protein
MRKFIAKRMPSFYIDVPALRPGTVGAYALVVVSVGVATALRLALDPYLGRAVRYVLSRSYNHNADQRVRCGLFLRRSQHCCLAASAVSGASLSRAGFPLAGAQRATPAARHAPVQPHWPACRQSQAGAQGPDGQARTACAPTPSGGSCRAERSRLPAITGMPGSSVL